MLNFSMACSNSQLGLLYKGHTSIWFTVVNGILQL